MGLIRRRGRPDAATVAVAAADVGDEVLAKIYGHRETYFGRTAATCLRCY